LQRRKIKEISKEDYNRILKDLELEQIILKDARISLALEEVAKILKSPQIEVEVKEKVKTEIANKKLIGSHYLAIKAFDSKTKNFKFKIECTFTCFFTYKSKPSSEFLKIFEKRNLRVFTIPYMREFIQNVSLKMGLPPLVLPLYKQF